MAGVDDWGKSGRVKIGYDEVSILVNGKGNYETSSLSGGKILHITEDGGINAITKEERSNTAKFNMLEVYA